MSDPTAALPPVNDFQLDVLDRALEVYCIQLDQLKQIVADVWDGDLRDNPMWIGAHKQQQAATQLKGEVYKASLVIERSATDVAAADDEPSA